VFLTQFPINRTRRRTQRLLASAYCMHAAVAGSFPPFDSGPSNSRVLWRVDMEPSATYLYIVSPTEPSLVGLDEQIGFPDRPPQWRTRPYEPLLDRLSSGQQWSFRLTANPVRDVIKDRSEQSTNVVGKRIGHVTVRQQESWLIGQAADVDGDSSDGLRGLASGEESRAARNGFDVCRDESGRPRLVVSGRRRYELRKSRDARPITLVTAQFDGVLQVTDVGRLRHALTNGIGHSKAFGCGLLTLAPLPRGEGAVS